MAEAAGVAIGLAWAIAGGLGFARLRAIAVLPAWLLLALSLALATAAALHWHVAVYQLARRGLAAAGVYEQRVWFKVLLGIATAAIAAALLRHVGGWLQPWPSSLRVAALLMGAWALYLLAFTAFLDDLLPAAFGTWPVRQLLEALFALAALLAAATAFFGRPSHAGPR